MWEGQSVSRTVQKVASAALALLATPFLYFGAFALIRSTTNQNASLSIVLAALSALLAGVFAAVVSYRLFFGRGVRQGGGMLSSRVYQVGGALFLALGVYVTFRGIETGEVKAVLGVAIAFALAMIFYTAAKHRSAMRNIEKPKNVA